MGCSFSSSPPASPLVAFTRAIEVVPWGVLGEAPSEGGSSPWQTTAVAPKPGAEMLIVDPASLNIIRDPYFRPGDAGGAAGAIYRFLGIASNETFPPDVANALNATGDAVHKRYGYPHAIHVIHTIGPDFKQLDVTEAEAIAELATAYASVLRQARDFPRPLLRLCPISSGIYAGRHKPRMPDITAQALLQAFERVASDAAASAETSARLPGQPEGCAKVELCVFEGKAAVKQYEAALRRAIDANVDTSP